MLDQKIKKGFSFENLLGAGARNSKGCSHSDIRDNRINGICRWSAQAEDGKTDVTAIASLLICISRQISPAQANSSSVSHRIYGKHCLKA